MKPKTSIADFELSSIQNIGSELTPLRSLHDEMMRDITKRLNCDIERTVQINLKKLGFEFETHEEFISFIKQRVRCISYKTRLFGSKNMFYLDFIDMVNIGTFIGGYEYCTTFKHQGMTAEGIIETKIIESL